MVHGVGGSFDVLAGLTQRAPQWWQDRGLEWLYRAWQEPVRLGRRYLTTNSAFMAMVAREVAAPAAQARVQPEAARGAHCPPAHCPPARCPPARRPPAAFQPAARPAAFQPAAGRLVADQAWTPAPRGAGASPAETELAAARGERA